MGIELDQRYQTEAYEQIKKDFENGKRSCIVMPTGCGKSYLAGKLIEENPSTRILYLSPSSVINVQLRKLLYDTNKKRNENVKYLTYNALSKMNTEDIEHLKPEIIILDELHRTGAQIWGRNVENLLNKYNHSKVLGLTATPVRTDGRNMAEEICGGISYSLEITEAIARGILPVPEYICSQYIFEEDIQRVEAQIEKMEDKEKKEEYKKVVEKARRHLEKADGIDEILGKHIEKKNGKYILFCKDIEDIDIKAEQIQEWFKKVNEKISIYKISSANERRENDEELEFFREKNDDTLKIALAVNMLNEGYHDSELSGVILTRNTMSEILFRQQLGRALSRDAQTTPQIFDLVNNIKYFEEVIREIKYAIEKGIERGEEKSKGYNSNIIEKFKIIQEQIDFIEEFKKIEANLYEYIQGETVISQLINILEKLTESRIDVSKIKKSKKINSKQYFQQLKDVVNPEIIEQNGLDGEYLIGQQLQNAIAAYNGFGSNAITREERLKLEELGIVQLNKKSKISELIEVLEKLKESGIDVSKLQSSKKSAGKIYYLQLKDIVNPEIIEQNGLDGEYPIGRQINYAITNYNATKDPERRAFYKIEEEDMIKLEELGIVKLNKKSKISELIEVLGKLKESEIDVSKLPISKNLDGKIYYLQLKDIVNPEIIEQNGLDGEYSIGEQIHNARYAYKGKGTSAIENEDKTKLEELGIVKLNEKSKVSELIEVLEKLKESGIDVSKIQIIKTINGERKYQKVKDVVSSEIIEQNGLDGEYPIGRQINNAITTYNAIKDPKRKSTYKMEEEDMRKLEDLGIVKLNKKSKISELIEILEKLEKAEIDVSKIKFSKIIDGKQIYKKLKDVVSSEIIEQNRLDGEYPIGRQINNAITTYNATKKPEKKLEYAITEEDKIKLEKLGLVKIKLAEKEAEQRELTKQLNKSDELLKKVEKELDKYIDK